MENGSLRGRKISKDGILELQGTVEAGKVFGCLSGFVGEGKVWFECG